MYLWPELWSLRVPAWARMSVRPRIMHISYVRNYSVVLENWEMALVVNALDLWRPLVAPWKCQVNFWEHVLGKCPVRHYVLLLDACGSPWGWNGRNSSCMQWLDSQKLFGSDLSVPLEALVDSCRASPFLSPRSKVRSARKETVLKLPSLSVTFPLGVLIPVPSAAVWKPLPV